MATTNIDVDKINVVASSLENVNNLLVFRQFNECLAASLEQLSVIRRNNKVESFDDLKEALCEVAIQAYAELDRWQEVLPFVTSIYTSLEEVPAKIIQLCILLHASMKDYPTCAALANVWLRNPNNYHSGLEDKYLETIDIYVGHVLIPANKWDEMQTFLENCPGLALHRKDQFLKVVRSLRHQVDQLNVEQIESAAEDTTDSQSEKLKAEHSHTLKPVAVSESSSFIRYVHYVSKWVSRNVPVVTLFLIKNISLVALLFYILISKAEIDFLSWPTLVKIWVVIVNLWKRMFAPFYQAKSEL